MDLVEHLVILVLPDNLVRQVILDRLEPQVRREIRAILVQLELLETLVIQELLVRLARLVQQVHKEIQVLQFIVCSYI